jgi:hypothetical protein
MYYVFTFPPPPTSSFTKVQKCVARFHPPGLEIYYFLIISAVLCVVFLWKESAFILRFDVLISVSILHLRRL